MKQRTTASSPWATLKNGLPTTRFSNSPTSLPIVLCVLVCVCVHIHNQTSASLLGGGSSWRCPCTIILPGRGLSCARLRLRFFRAALCWHTFCKHFYTHTNNQTHMYLVCLSFFLSVLKYPCRLIGSRFPVSFFSSFSGLLSFLFGALFAYRFLFFPDRMEFRYSVLITLNCRSIPELICIISGISVGFLNLYGRNFCDNQK